MVYNHEAPKGRVELCPEQLAVRIRRNLSHALSTGQNAVRRNNATLTKSFYAACGRLGVLGRSQRQSFCTATLSGVTQSPIQNPAETASSLLDPLTTPHREFETRTRPGQGRFNPVRLYDRRGNSIARGSCPQRPVPRILTPERNDVPSSRPVNFQGALQSRGSPLGDSCSG